MTIYIREAIHDLGNYQQALLVRALKLWLKEGPEPSIENLPFFNIDLAIACAQACFGHFPTEDEAALHEIAEILGETAGCEHPECETVPALADEGDGDGYILYCPACERRIPFPISNEEAQ
jgi:hypothetical protein